MGSCHFDYAGHCPDGAGYLGDLDMSDGIKTGICRHSKKPVWDGGSGTMGKACRVAWPTFTQEQRDRFIEMYVQYHGFGGYRHG